jgi:hypothetical protein
MRRKTAPKDPVHPEVSRASASELGLIAMAEESAQSAMGECVLDNRSHRTTQGSGVRGRRATLSPAPKHARPRIHCSRSLGRDYAGVKTLALRLALPMLCQTR